MIDEPVHYHAWPRQITVALMSNYVLDWCDLSALSRQDLFRNPYIGKNSVDFIEKQLMRRGLSSSLKSNSSEFISISEINDNQRRAQEMTVPVDLSCVYFIRCNQFVKIGRARNVRERLRDLQLSNPYELELVAVEMWDVGMLPIQERKWHDELRASHIKGEWFKSDERIRAAVRYLNLQWANVLRETFQRSRERELEHYENRFNTISDDYGPDAARSWAICKSRRREMLSR